MSTDADVSRIDIRHRLDGLDIYYGWIIVGACFLVGIITWGTLWSFGVFFGHIVDEFGLSHANTSVIFSLQSIVTFTGAAILGLGIDRYGARRLLLVAAGLVVAGLVGVSQLPSFLAVTLSYGILAALGFGIAFVVSYVAPVRWFDRRRGLATGIATAGAGVGIVVIPPVAEAVIGRVGWRIAYASLTLAFLAAFVLAAIVFADRPRDLGIDSSLEFSDETESTDPITGEWRSQIDAITDVVQSPAFGMVFLAYICLSAPMIVLLVNVVEYTSAVGLGRGVGVLAISVLGAMNVVGKFAGGPVVDRVGPAPTVAASGGFQAVGLAILLVVQSGVGALIAAIVFGFGWGIWIGFLSPLLADLFGTLNINALFGTAAVAFAVSGSIAPYLAGLGVDHFGTFRPVFMAAGVLAVVGAVVTLGVDRLPGDDSVDRGH